MNLQGLVGRSAGGGKVLEDDISVRGGMWEDFLKMLLQDALGGATCGATSCGRAPCGGATCGGCKTEEKSWKYVNNHDILKNTMSNICWCAACSNMSLKKRARCIQAWILLWLLMVFQRFYMIQLFTF